MTEILDYNKINYANLTFGKTKKKDSKYICSLSYIKSQCYIQTPQVSLIGLSEEKQGETSSAPFEQLPSIKQVDSASVESKTIIIPTKESPTSGLLGSVEKVPKASEASAEKEPEVVVGSTKYLKFEVSPKFKIFCTQFEEALISAIEGNSEKLFNGRKLTKEFIKNGLKSIIVNETTGAVCKMEFKPAISKESPTGIFSENGMPIGVGELKKGRVAVLIISPYQLQFGAQTISCLWRILQMEVKLPKPKLSSYVIKEYSDDELSEAEDDMIDQLPTDTPSSEAGEEIDPLNSDELDEESLE